MKLTIYKRKEIDGEVFATRDVECEINVDNIVINSYSLKKLYKIIPKKDFNQLIAEIETGKISLAACSQLYDIFEDKNDDLIYFIRHVIIESGPYVTAEQLKTVKIDEMVKLLGLIFRPCFIATRQTFKVVTKDEAIANNGQQNQQRGNNNC